MRPFENLIDGVPWLGAMLFQVTLIAALGTGLWLALRRLGSAARPSVLLACLASVLVVPVLALMVPVWLPIPEMGLGASSTRQASASTVVVLPPPVVLSPPDSAPPQPQVEKPATAPKQLVTAVRPPAGSESSPAAVDAHRKAGIAEPTVTLPAPEPAVPPSPAWGFGELAAGLWFLGAGFSLLVAGLRLVSLAICWKNARPLHGAERERLAELDSLGAECGLGGPIALRETAAVGSPLALGLWRPAILLPLSWRGWTAEQRTAILAHELAHLRRRDFVAGLVAELARCVYWFHPLVRWLVGRLRLEQEYSADAWAVSVTSDPDHYVCCLAQLALSLDRGKTRLAPAMWHRRPEILRRIDMLRQYPGRAQRLAKSSSVLGVLVAVATCIAVAGVGYLPAEGGQPAAAQGGTGDKDRADALGDPLPAGALARFGTLRWRHPADVSFVAFALEGKAVLTAGEDGSIRLWDRETGKEIRRFSGPAADQPARGGVMLNGDAGWVMGGSGAPVTLAVSADGKVLAMADAKGLRLLDLTTGKELRTLKSPRGGVTSLLFSPDGTTLAVRGAAGGFAVLQTGDGKEIQQIKAPQQDGVRFLILGQGGDDSPGWAISHDAKALATADSDFDQQNGNVSNFVRLWSLETAKEIRKIDLKNDVASAVAYSPNGKMLAYVGGKAIHLLEPDGGKEIRQFKHNAGSVTSLVFAPDSKSVAARSRNGIVRVWDTDSGKELEKLGEAIPRPVAFGNQFFIGGLGSMARRDLAFSPDGKTIAAASGQSVRLWEAATGKEQTASTPRSKVTAVVLTPDGKVLVSRGADGVIRRWDAVSGKELNQFREPQGTTCGAFTVDGRLVALGAGDGTIRVCDTTSGKELHKLKGHTGGTGALAFSRDGKMLSSRSAGDDDVRLHDVTKGSELQHIVLQKADAADAGGVVVLLLNGFGGALANVSLAFSPDGQTVVTNLGANNYPAMMLNPGGDAPAGNTRLQMWDVATGKATRQITLPSQAGVASLAYSPDGRILAVENTDQTISLWEVASAKERAKLGKAVQPAAADGGMNATVVAKFLGGAGMAGPVANATTMVFSPDGGLLASRGPGNSVRVWDVAAAKEIGQFKGHEGPVTALAFAADGKTLATGSSDTTILTWNAAALKREPRPPVGDVDAKQVDALWSNLAGDDAAKAFQSILALAAAPKQAVPFLRERLQAAAAVDRKTLERLVNDLDSEKYAVRQKATEELHKLGDLAIPPLKKLIASQPTLETRRRAEILLDKLIGGVLTPEQIRMVRAVEVLEKVGTPEARQIIETLAQGAPGALPTRQAQAVLERMERRQ
jgi:WD40 repeat protein/beta-lactamase regulating signal transducer with metallopeptidase domain